MTTSGLCSVVTDQTSRLVMIHVTGAGTGTVYAQFASGATQDAQLQFTKVSGPCGCGLQAAVSWPPSA